MLLLLVACQRDIPDLENADTELTIAYYNENMFHGRYGTIIEAEYPRLRYQIQPFDGLSNRETSVTEWYGQYHADVIYVPATRMQAFIEEGLLVELDHHLARRGVSLEDWHPTIMEHVRDLGRGKIYGIPPTSDGKVMVYNGTLLEDMKISVPDASYRWEDWLSVIERFPGNGLIHSYGDIFEFIYDYGATEGHSLYRSEIEEVSFNSPGWLGIWQRLAPLFRSGTISTGGSQIVAQFSEGEVPFALINMREVRSLEAFDPPFDWELVSLPSNRLDPQTSFYQYVDGFYAVSAKTERIDEAIALVLFLNSEKIVRWEGGSYGIPTRNTTFSLYGQMPLSQPAFFTDSLPYEIYRLGIEAGEAMINNQQSIEEILEQAQQKAKQELEVI